MSNGRAGKGSALSQQRASDGAPQQAERSHMLVHDKRGGHMVDVCRVGGCGQREKRE